MRQDAPNEAGKGAPPVSPSEGGSLAPVLAPVLGQVEVDRLVGYADVVFASPEGIRAAAHAGEPSRPSLPILDSVVERFVRRATPALADRFGLDASLTWRSIQSVRFGDYVEGLPLPVEAFAFRAEGWAGSGLVTLGPAFSPLALDTLLGGGRVGARKRALSRPATPIEAGILSRLVALLLVEAAAAFSDVTPVAFRVDGAVDRIESSEIARPSEEVLVLPFEIAIEGRLATFDLVLPASTLQPVRQLLAGRFTGEKLGRDTVWSTHLATEMWQANVDAEAVLHEFRLPLGQILALGVGDTITLDVKPSDPVDLRCGPLLLTRGRMGRVDGKIALQVVEPLRPVVLHGGASVRKGNA